MAWLFDSADEVDIDPTRIAIGGRSAGGGLCAGLALLARDRGEITPCFQLLTYPMLDDRNDTASSYEITDQRVWHREANLIGWDAYLSGAAGSDDVAIYTAPARASDPSALPPELVTVAECGSNPVASYWAVTTSAKGTGVA